MSNRHICPTHGSYHALDGRSCPTCRDVRRWRSIIECGEALPHVVVRAQRALAEHDERFGLNAPEGVADAAHGR